MNIIIAQLWEQSPWVRKDEGFVKFKTAATYNEVCIYRRDTELIVRL